MTRPPGFRVGLVLALLVLSAFALRAPAPSIAQDGDAAATPPPDTAPPVVDAHPDVLAAATDGSGALVDYALPLARDDTDDPVPVACDPAPGSLFPLGSTTVVCSAADAAGNVGQTTFAVAVTDQTPPTIAGGDDIVVAAADASGAAVAFPVPAAQDNVDGAVAVTCDPAPGAVFPVGTTVVACTARDAAGNAATPVSFTVTVDALPTATPTAPATATPTEPPAPTDGPSATGTPEPTAPVAPTAPWTDEPGASATAPSPTPTTASPPTPTPTPKADGETSAPSTAPTPDPLAVDQALIGSFTIVTDGGPLGVLASIWGGEDWPISQEFGHTAFSVAHHSWYAYGADYGLDGYEHPGLDVGMPRGTPLYSPVAGVVQIAGGVPYYTFYGNSQPGVGELLIRTADGNEVILGHLGRIAVAAGQEVGVGQFVGLSGGDNGDHVHLEARELQPGGGYQITDPRRSFLVPALEDATTRASDDTKYARITVRRLACAVDADGNAVSACGDDVVAGAAVTVTNPTGHPTTRATDQDGRASFAPRAGEDTVAVGEEGFAGAYVACVAKGTGRVLFRGAIAEPSVALDTVPGERIACDWYDLAGGAPAGAG
jgi:murein DD-endopeptidase MepM/ murein hydrolase activator NlpD